MQPLREALSKAWREISFAYLLISMCYLSSRPLKARLKVGKGRSLGSLAVSLCVIVLGLLWESWPPLLSARLSAIIIALLLTEKWLLRIRTEVKLNGRITVLRGREGGGGTLCGRCRRGLPVPSWFGHGRICMANFLKIRDSEAVSRDDCV